MTLSCQIELKRIGAAAASRAVDDRVAMRGTGGLGASDVAP
jgi:hypothetical protein